MTSAVHSHTAFLDAELKSALEEGNQAVDLHSAWLLETVEANTKNLRFQRCAQRLRTERSTSAAPPRAAHAPAGARQSPICLLTSRPPAPGSNPSLVCPRSARKPKRGKAKKGLATLAVRATARSPCASPSQPRSGSSPPPRLAPRLAGGRGGVGEPRQRGGLLHAQRGGRSSALAAWPEPAEQRQRTWYASRSLVPPPPPAGRQALTLSPSCARAESGSKRKESAATDASAEAESESIGETKRVKRDDVVEALKVAEAANAASAESGLAKLKASKPGLGDAAQPMEEDKGSSSGAAAAQEEEPQQVEVPDFNKKKVTELRALLQEAGLDDKGKKAELVERMTQYTLAQQQGAASDDAEEAQPSPEAADAEMQVEEPSAGVVAEEAAEEDAAEEDAAGEEAVVEQAQAQAAGASMLMLSPLAEMAEEEEMEEEEEAAQPVEEAPAPAPAAARQGSRRGSVPRAAAPAEAAPAAVVDDAAVAMDDEAADEAADDAAADEEQADEEQTDDAEAASAEAPEEAEEEAAAASEQAAQHFSPREQAAPPSRPSNESGGGASSSSSILGRLKGLAGSFGGSFMGGTPAAPQPPSRGSSSGAGAQSSSTQPPGSARTHGTQGYTVTDELQRKMEERRSKLERMSDTPKLNSANSSANNSAAQATPTPAAPAPVGTDPLELKPEIKVPTPFAGGGTGGGGALEVVAEDEEGEEDEHEEEPAPAPAPAPTRKSTKGPSKPLVPPTGTGAKGAPAKGTSKPLVSKQEEAKRRREEQEREKADKLAAKELAAKEQRDKLEQKQRDEKERREKEQRDKAAREEDIRKRREEMELAKKQPNGKKRKSEEEPPKQPKRQGKQPASSNAAPAPSPAPAPAPAATPAPKPTPTAAPAAAASPLPEGWKAYTDKTSGKTYYHNAKLNLSDPSKATTWVKPRVEAVMIPVNKPSTGSDEGDEEESGSEDEADVAKAANKPKLPSWAQAGALMSQLQKQPDPTQGDAIFGQRIHEMEEPIRLRDVFGSSPLKRAHHRRGSSAHWQFDRLTQEEEQEYIEAHGGAYDPSGAGPSGSGSS